MSKILTIGLVLFLVGCSSMPKPPSCEGNFRPVNGEAGGAVTLSPQASAALCTGVQHG